MVRRAESALCRLSLAFCESVVLLLPCRLILGLRVVERDLRGVSALAGVCALLCEALDGGPADCPLPEDVPPPKTVGGSCSGGICGPPNVPSNLPPVIGPAGPIGGPCGPSNPDTGVCCGGNPLY